MKLIIRVLCFYFIIALTLSFIWFHSGLIVALGESAIPFYNPNYVLHFYGQTWVPVSLGYFPGTTLTTVPFFIVEAALFNAHIPGYIIEAIFFGLFTFLGMAGGYFCFLMLLSFKNKTNHFVAIVGGLLYLFNLVSLVIGFNRMQFPFTIFYLSLPFALLFFALGILKKQMRYVFFFNIVLIPFASAFGGLPFLELFWFLLFSYLIFTLLLSWNKKKEWVFPICFFIFCFTLWVLCNMWWLPIVIQYALFTPHPAYNVKGDIGTFNILSEDQGNLSYLFRLMNQHFLQSMIPTWGKLFFSPLLIVISYLVPFLAFLPLLFKRKPAIIYFFLAFALLGIFLSKGSAGPFGQLFLFLFSHSTILQVFRNSFEKIGLLLPIAYSPLIAYSLWIIFSWIRPRYNKMIQYGFVGGIVFCLCGILVYPFWNGWVFTYNLPPESNNKIGDYVKVPNYYDLANSYLSKDPSDSRILALPMGGEGITTTWDHPYNGVEFTNGLLGRSAISYTTIMPNLDLITTQLNTTFLKEPHYIEPIMHLLDAKYLMIRSDIDYKGRLMPSPVLFNRIASSGSLQGLTHTREFGLLNFYTTDIQQNKIYVASSIYSADKTMPYASVFALTEFKNNDVILDTGENTTADAFANDHSQAAFFMPDYSIDYSSYPAVSLSTAETMVPGFYRFLPSSPLYVYQKIKEQFERSLQVDEEDKMFYDMDVLLTRIGELQRVVLDRNKNNIPLAEQNYMKQLADIKKHAVNEYPKEIIRNINNFRYRVVSQQVLLDNLIKTVKDPGIEKSLSSLQERLTDFAIATHARSIYDNSLYLSEDSKRIVYQFNLQGDTNYQLLLKVDSFSTYYENENVQWKVYINNSQQFITPVIENGWFNFGTFHLKKGLNEIHISVPIPKNLIQKDTSQVTVLHADNKTKEQKMSLPLEPFDAGAPYKVTFDYRLNVAGGARIEADSEFNTVQNGKYIPEWSMDLGKTYGEEWTTTSSIVYPFSTASEQNVAFVVAPVNNCLRQNQGNAFAIEKCTKNKNFRDSYNEATNLEIKNIRVERIFSNSVVLKQINSTVQAINDKQSISYHRIDASNYTVTIKNAQKPFLLIFSETYYPAWQAIFTDTKRKVSEENHFLVNTYANAWYINRKGDFTLSIEFAHEKVFTLGKTIAIPIILITLGLSIYFLIKRRGE